MSEEAGKWEVAKDEVSVGRSTNQLIALALEKQADPGTLEKLMDLQERWEAGQAQKAFVKAMSAFKQEAPSVLKKGDRVNFTTTKGTTSYNYANLGSIVQEITAMLGKNELSASWNTRQTDKGDVEVTCNITHVAGHRESVVLRGPVDQSGNKNPIQAIGSTVTYLQRYTLLAALGLATGESDDDGQGGSSRNPDPDKSPFKDPPAGIQKPDPGKFMQEPDPSPDVKIHEPEPMSDPQLKKIRAMIGEHKELSADDKKACYDWIKEHKATTVIWKEKPTITKDSASDIIEHFDGYFSDWLESVVSQSQSAELPWEDPPPGDEPIEGVAE